LHTFNAKRRGLLTNSNVSFISSFTFIDYNLLPDLGPILMEVGIAFFFGWTIATFICDIRYRRKMDRLAKEIETIVERAVEKYEEGKRRG